MPFKYICEYCLHEFSGKHAPESGRHRFCRKACWYAFKTEPATVKFWRFVNKTDSCWLWTGSLMGNGYGCFQHTEGGKRIIEYAHRFAWELNNGPIPDGMNVLHDCPDGDTPRCVLHLWLGTQGENIADMIDKGRHKNAISKETFESVKKMLLAGESYNYIARAVGIRNTSVSRIFHGRMGSHVPWPC